MTTFHRLKRHWEKSRCLFLLQDLEFSKILLYYDNINPGQPLSHLYGQSWHGSMKIKFGILKNYSYICIDKTKEHYEVFEQLGRS